MSEPRVFAIILAAGRSERMGFDKIRFPLRGKPVWRYSYDTFANHPDVEAVGIVGEVSAANEDSPSPSRPTGAESDEAKATGGRGGRGVRVGHQPAWIIPGGKTRTESSQKGLEATPDWADIVLIHDAARPFVTPEVISRVIQGVKDHQAASPGIPSADTIKRQTAEGIETLDRQKLFATQTPQGAYREQLLSLYRVNNQEYTDDMAMLEANGIQPQIVPGDPNNFKITTPEDIARAAALLGTPEIRTGLGYDIHRFSTDPNRPLWLGGVKFDNYTGLDGHSDADAVLHAVVDSLLGAASLGDIGAIFPNTDPQWKDAPSIQFVAYAGRELETRGWQILNVDIAVIAEFPKVMKRAIEIRQTIANALECDLERISIKATTNEQLGSIGRGEGIAAFATATIRQRF